MPMFYFQTCFLYVFRGYRNGTFALNGLLKFIVLFVKLLEVNKTLLHTSYFTKIYSYNLYQALWLSVKNIFSQTMNKWMFSMFQNTELHLHVFKNGSIKTFLSVARASYYLWEGKKLPCNDVLHIFSKYAGKYSRRILFRVLVFGRHDKCHVKYLWKPVTLFENWCDFNHWIFTPLLN